MTTAPTIEFAAEPINLAWFRGAHLLKLISVTSYAITHDLWTLDPHTEAKRCYCYSCVEKRNSCDTAPRIENPPAPMELIWDAPWGDPKIAAENYIARKHRVKTTPLRENISIRGKFASGLPVKTSCFDFETRIEEKKIKKIWIGTMRARRNRFGQQTVLAHEVFDGPVVPIWHQPSHSIFEKTVGESQRQFKARVFANNRYAGEHVVSIGSVRVPIDDIYSQGEHGVSIDGKEVLVTDWWATKYKSGWRGFIDPRIRLDNGDRLRDEFFEPSAEQIACWLKKYTINGKFKPKRRVRFSKMLPKWMFKNRTDEAPPIAQAIWFRGDEDYDQNLSEIDGVYADDDLEVGGWSDDQSELNPYQFSKPRHRWIEDSDSSFVTELTKMFPSSQLRIYQSGPMQTSEDYDPKRHLHRLYDYDYPPGELGFGKVFYTTWDTTRTKYTADSPQVVRMTWDRAIENTFNLRQELPSSGLYARYKISDNTPTRIYLVQSIPSIDFDADEDPAPFGSDDMYNQIRETAADIKSKIKLETIKKNLRKLATGGKSLAYIRFRLVDNKLKWDACPMAPIAVESVASKQ